MSCLIMKRFALSIKPIKQIFQQLMLFFSRFDKKEPIIIEENLNDEEKKQFSFFRLLGIISLIITTAIMGLFIIYSSSKFLPETYLEEVRIGGLTIEEASTKLAHQYPTPPEHIIQLKRKPIETLTEALELELENKNLNDEININQEIIESSSSTELEAYYDYHKISEEIIQKQQENPVSWVTHLFFASYSPKKYSLPILYKEEKLVELIKNFKNKFDQEPQHPEIVLTQTNNPNTLSLQLGKTIFHVDEKTTLENLKQKLEEKSFYNYIKTEATGFDFFPETYIASMVLNDEQKASALQTASKLVGVELEFSYDIFKKTLNDQKLISFIKFPEGFFEDRILDQVNSWKETLDRPSQNAIFEFDKKTLEVTEFFPHKEGLVLNAEKTEKDIKDVIFEVIRSKEKNNDNQDDKNIQKNSSEKKLEYKKDFEFITASPEITLEQTNNLGIKERIGFGDSYYDHSIPSRIHNVAITSERINYAIVPPGKEFSFNKTLGDVSSTTGFQPAYVIKDGQTVLGDGGGVCQVSTTLFRSLLDAGLKITLRLPHSYRVSYYELDNKTGFDATVYDGNVDLRFINDTEDYVLIYTENNREDLYMKVELYGTSDGRTTEISDYKTWDFRAPLATEYIPDPSLPSGKLKQIDWSSSGIKAQFTHTIKDKDGNIIKQKNYYSNYRPWAANYLQGI